MAFASKRWHFYLMKRKVAAFNETAGLQEVVCSASLNHRVTRAGGHLVPPTAQVWGRQA